MKATLLPLNPFAVPEVLYLGTFAPADIPLIPGLFRWGRHILATDGKRVFGPFMTERDAKYELTFALLKRRRRRIEWTVYLGCVTGILVLSLILATQR